MQQHCHRQTEKGWLEKQSAGWTITLIPLDRFLKISLAPFPCQCLLLFLTAAYSFHKGVRHSPYPSQKREDVKTTSPLG